MANSTIITPEEIQTAAIKYRKQLLMLPILGIRRSTQFMTEIPGVAGKFVIGEADFDAQFAPYKSSRTGTEDLHLNLRELETHLGNVVQKFEPNSVAKTVFAAGATKGDGQKNTPVALLALASIAKNLSRHLNNALWNATRNPSGDTTKDLFDGFDTITQKELTATNLSADKGNYYKMTEEITAENAVDVAKDIITALSPELREEDTFLYCSPEFYDNYCEAYKVTGAGLVYNKQYEQVYVEGSNRRCTLVPLANKSGSNFMHLTTKSNMLVGYDQMGDVEKVLVEKYEPFLLSYVATMYFGVQFHTLDKRMMMVVDLRTT